MAPLPGHTNLYTGDCNCHFYNPEMWQPEGVRYSAMAIHRYVDRLADGGIDTDLVNPIAMIPWYPSKVAPTILDGYRRGDHTFFASRLVGRKMTPQQKERALDRYVELQDMYLDLVEDGVDWVAEVAKACRRRGISPWLTVRMNDMHGHTNPASYFNPPLYRDPANRLRGRKVDPRQGTANVQLGMNYEVPAVRDYYFSIIRELVEEYDFEGLELDWTRHPLCVEPPASDDAIATVLKWHGQVRSLTEARAARTGRPYPLGLRVPPRLGNVRDMGVDVAAMVERGMLDFIGFGKQWLTTWDYPYDEVRARLGDRIAMYGDVDDAPNDVKAIIPSTGQRGIRYLSASAKLMRANAAGKLALGVDGVKSFNFFCTDSWRNTDEGAIPGLYCDFEAMRGLDDLNGLRGRTKHYCLQGMHFYSEAWPHLEQTAQLPIVLEPTWRHGFRLSLCVEPAGSGRQLVAQLVYETGEETPTLGIGFNDAWPRFDATATRRLLFPTGPFEEHIPENEALELTLDIFAIREGWNEIVVFNETPGAADPAARRAKAVKLVSIELAVR